MGRVGVRVLRGLETTLRFSPILTFPRQGGRGITDIPHCLVHVCEYAAVKPFIRFPQEFEQLRMLLGQIQYQRPLPGDEEQVNPHKIVKDPPRCRILYGVPFW
jgi:hypothetical protein